MVLNAEMHATKHGRKSCDFEVRSVTKLTREEWTAKLHRNGIFESVPSRSSGVLSRDKTNSGHRRPVTVIPCLPLTVITATRRDDYVVDGFVLQDIPSAQKRWKNPMKKSPIMNWAMNKKSGKGHLSQDLITPGQLFGLPLTSLTTNEELVPKPVEDILIHLFKKAPSTVGIFRKSGLMKTMKQVRQALNEGLPVDLEDKSAVLLSTILKEFFRSLPDCIFGSEFYEEFVATRDMQDATARSEEVKKILNKLPKPNQELIKRFLCLAYHIAKYSERNSMTASNLAVCIAPSLIWPPGQERLMSPETTGSAAEFVAFVIENFVAIYGEESLTLLGDESEILLDSLPEEEPEPTGEQVIFHCQQGEDNNSARIPELKTSISYAGEYTQDEDDNSSDERLNLNNSLNLTSVSLIPSQIGDSKSSPSSPFPSRKQSPISGKNFASDDGKRTENGFLDNMTTIRRHSDQDLNDDGSIRKGPKYTRVKRTLISTTTSAELIEHRRPFQNDSSPRLGIRSSPHGGASPQTVRVMSPASTSPRNKQVLPEQARLGNHRTYFPAGGESTYLDTSDTTEKLSTSNLLPKSSSGGSNHGSETSSSDGRCSPSRSPLSSPVLRRKLQGVDGRPIQADIVMQNFYRRQQPAAPSYDEHIQRRQLWQRQGHSQRLGSDSSDKQNDIDDKKGYIIRNVKGDADIQSSSIDYESTHTNSKEVGRSQTGIDREGGRTHRDTDNEVLLTGKLSPRLHARRLEADSKNPSDSSIYSRFAGDNPSGSGGSLPRVFVRPQVESGSKTDSRNSNARNFNASALTANSSNGGTNLTHGAQSNSLYTGIPVKSNLAHFPTSDFFPKEAKSVLKSSTDTHHQSPWFKEDSHRKYVKSEERLHESNSNESKVDRVDRVSVLSKNIVGGDLAPLDVHAIPQLTEAETPTLEDFQNFMFQDESRV